MLLPDTLSRNIEDDYNSWSRKTKISNLLNNVDEKISYEVWLKEFIKTFTEKVPAAYSTPNVKSIKFPENSRVIEIVYDRPISYDINIKSKIIPNNG